MTLLERIKALNAIEGETTLLITFLDDAPPMEGLYRGHDEEYHDYESGEHEEESIEISASDHEPWTVIYVSEVEDIRVVDNV